MAAICFQGNPISAARRRQSYITLMPNSKTLGLQTNTRRRANDPSHTRSLSANMRFRRSVRARPTNAAAACDANMYITQAREQNFRSPLHLENYRVVGVSPPIVRRDFLRVFEALRPRHCRGDSRRHSILSGHLVPSTRARAFLCALRASGHTIRAAQHPNIVWSRARDVLRVERCQKEREISSCLGIRILGDFSMSVIFLSPSRLKKRSSSSFLEISVSCLSFHPGNIFFIQR